MARKNRTPEEKARRAKIRELLQESNISSMEDIQNLFKETIAEFMENGLDAELDEELGYSKYDYRNKETDNSRNGHSSKKLKTSFGEVEVSVPRDRKGEFEPQLLKKHQTSISQDKDNDRRVGIPRQRRGDDDSSHYVNRAVRADQKAAIDKAMELKQFARDFHDPSQHGADKEKQNIILNGNSHKHSLTLLVLLWYPWARALRCAEFSPCANPIVLPWLRSHRALSQSDL